MENLYVEKPIYPLVSLLSSILIFFIGLSVSKEIKILYLLLALTIVYLLFGYTRVLLRSIPVFFIIGAIVGAGAFLTSGNYMIGIQTTGRILLLAYSSVIMIALPPINLIRNFIQLKFPRVIALGMLVTIRFVPILLNETKQIMEAMKTRGANVRWYNLSCIYRAFIIPFLMRIISMTDIMAISIETRGFVLSDKTTTVYKEVNITKRDIVFTLFLLTIMIGVILI